MLRTIERMTKTIAIVMIGAVSSPVAVTAADGPALPAGDGKVSISAQEWPHKLGPREINVFIHYPGGKLESVNQQTGLMLTLHNWGGTACAGTANPQQLANRYNVVAICVDYLQSGREGIDLEAPYDFGYLQALDALRALYFVYDGLKQTGRSFHTGRTYATGGSGGGNVTLMVNKLAPRTFACIVDMCGMAKLTDDIAFNLPGGSGLNAGYSRDPNSPHYLTPDRQQLHFLGHPQHLATMKGFGNAAKVVVVHGTADATCPFADAREMVENMRAAGFDVDAHFLTDNDLDGTVFKSTGHSLGDRTQIVFKTADEYLLPDSPRVRFLKQPCDFERKDSPVRYATQNGEFTISYADGFPVGTFAAKE